MYCFYMVVDIRVGHTISQLKYSGCSVGHDDL